jgi:hypothetical protein
MTATTHCFKWMGAFLALSILLSMSLDATAAQKRRRARACKKPAARTAVKTIVPGMWGGPHIAMRITAGGAEIEFDCAHGTIEQPITLDSNERFDVPGTFVAEGGPVSVPVDPGGSSSTQKVIAARYQGRVEGKRLILTVVMDSGKTSSLFSLTHANPPGLTKCY